MDAVNRDRIAWALMIIHYKEKGIYVGTNLAKGLEELNLGVPIEDMEHLACCMIMEIAKGLPWHKIGSDMSRRPPDNTVWPVFKALVSRHPALRTLRHSDPDITDTLEAVLHVAVPELARRAGLGDAEVSEVFVLAANEILDGRERSPNTPTAPPPSDGNTST